jgi:hypothetical protein
MEDKIKESKDLVDEFFEKIRKISFFQKIFSWKKFLDLREGASKYYIEFKNKNTREKEKLLEKDNEKLNSKCEYLEKEYLRVEKENEKLNTKLEKLNEEFHSLKLKITKIKENEEIKRKEYEKQINSLTQARENFESDKIRVQKEKEEERERMFEEMKNTWKIHEDICKNELKNLTSKLDIEYIENPPFKGKPDNVIKIAEEYIIFDAKSPANDNLENFHKYIKTQVDNLKKYAMEKDVKKELFLIIPNNTVDKIKDFYEKTGDYDVFIITLNSLVPILLNLQKVEEYEFTEELSPEDRQNISRVIGKFAHATKRKIQIDTWLNSHFIEILNNCETLPSEIIEEVKKSSISQKLNTPTDRKHKELSDRDVKEDNDKIKRLALSQRINLKDTEKIEDIKVEEDFNK